MTTSPYRIMETPQQPQFTFTERMFVSNKLRHRILGHTILIGKPIVLIGGVLLAFVVVMSAVGGLLWLAGVGIEGLTHYLITRHQFTKAQIFITVMTIVISVCVIPPIVSKIKKMVRENNEHMKQVISKKIEKRDGNDDSQ